MSDRITYFAKTDSRNKHIPFGIKGEDRTRHVYIIGKTGMGKSTVLENMIAQDIRNGEGFGFIDPHGKSAEVMLDYIPKERIDDVLYFAPFDLDYPVAFNVMEDVGYDKRHLVVSGLMSAFKKIWIDAWSARMEYILTNTLLALLEYPDATILGVNRMYTDKVYRKKVVDYVKDPVVRSFWVDEFATYTDRYTQEATPAIQNKIGQFTGNPLIRNIVGQPKSTFDIRQMMDNRKIIIMNLSKGKVGEVNANLLGSMLITKIYLAAMSRADVAQNVLQKLPNFYFYVDEFQSFANESFADILSEARKYKLNLTMAHQYIEQMSEEVRAAVFGNVGTMIAFRVGAFDSEVLEKEFAPQFTAEDLVNLGFAQIYLKLMIDGVSSQPFSAETLPPLAAPEQSFREEVIARSRQKYARARADVEQEIEAEYMAKPAPVPSSARDSGERSASMPSSERRSGSSPMPWSGRGETRGGMQQRESSYRRPMPPRSEPVRGERPMMPSSPPGRFETPPANRPVIRQPERPAEKEHRPFAQALSTLNVVPPVPLSEPHPGAASVRRPDAFHEKKDAPRVPPPKTVFKESRNTLRDALADVLKKSSEEAGQQQKAPSAPAKQSLPQEPHPQQKEAPKQVPSTERHEVHEDVLRFVLTGDEDR